LLEFAVAFAASRLGDRCDTRRAFDDAISAAYDRCAGPAVKQLDEERKDAVRLVTRRPQAFSRSQSVISNVPFFIVSWNLKSAGTRNADSRMLFPSQP
jgi:hypothetical protein